MKVTKAQMLANRAHIIAKASTLFRERGYDGVGVADLMAAAGFTHGGFYKHFRSKTNLMAEAATCGFAQTAAKTAGLDAIEFVKHYLSRQHRDVPGKGCTMAALCGDAARQPKSIKAAFAAGIESLLASPERENDERDDGLRNGGARSDTRSQRLEMMTQVIGALVLSRACPDNSPLADEILDVCRTAILSRLSSSAEA
jgi:TetR/AcrR family transcriptional repressor of nem operon